MASRQNKVNIVYDYIDIAEKEIIKEMARPYNKRHFKTLNRKRHSRT